VFVVVMVVMFPMAVTAAAFMMLFVVMVVTAAARMVLLVVMVVAAAAHVVLLVVMVVAAAALVVRFVVMVMTAAAFVMLLVVMVVTAAALVMLFVVMVVAAAAVCAVFMVVVLFPLPAGRPGSIPGVDLHAALNRPGNLDQFGDQGIRIRGSEPQLFGGEGDDGLLHGGVGIEFCLDLGGAVGAVQIVDDVYLPGHRATSSF
jgi:hypothetical protein